MPAACDMMPQRHAEWSQMAAPEEIQTFLPAASGQQFPTGPDRARHGIRKSRGAAAENFSAATGVRNKRAWLVVVAKFQDETRDHRIGRQGEPGRIKPPAGRVNGEFVCACIGERRRYTSRLTFRFLASVAQRQSTGFVNRRLWVQIPPLALRSNCGDQRRSRPVRDRRSSPGDTVSDMAGETKGGVPERPMGPDCKSGGSAFGGSNPPAPTKRGFQSSVFSFQNDLPVTLKP